MGTVKVNITGKDYNINSNEDKDYVVAIAKKLDKKLSDLMQINETLSYADACMLVALASIDDGEKLSKELDNIRFQLKEYIDDATKATTKANELEKRVEILERDNKKMSNELQIYTLKEKLDDVKEKE